MKYEMLKTKPSEDYTYRLLADCGQKYLDRMESSHALQCKPLLPFVLWTLLGFNLSLNFRFIQVPVGVFMWGNVCHINGIW